jgi:hypothetical protein
MYLIDVLNDFWLLYFIDMIYAIKSFNPMVNFVIQLSDKKLSEVSYY